MQCRVRYHAYTLFTYLSFINRVSNIGKSNLTQEQAFEELNQAAALAVLGVTGAGAIRALDLGALGTTVAALLAGWNFAIGQVWFE
jgi:hypothetical protein